MRKVLFLVFPVIFLAFFLSAVSVSAVTCEEKPVCIDNDHVGMQTKDCKVLTAVEFMNQMSEAFGQGTTQEMSYSCYTSCKDGACVDDNIPSVCKETDGGKDYFIKGDVTLKGNGEQVTASDYCIDNNYLGEIDCPPAGSGKSLQTNKYKCPNGCKNGACLKNASGSTGSVCTDSDGGKDIFKLGIIMINGKKESLSDTCGFGPQTINEKFCLANGTFSSEEMKCPGMCQLVSDGSGSYCTKSCEKSLGYYPYDMPKNEVGIAFLNKDCKWDKITPCQSHSANIGECTSAGNLIDTDGDGLLDVNEQKFGTDPNKFDTDGDGFGDMTEIYGGYNPLGAGMLTADQTALASEILNSSTTNLNSTISLDIASTTEVLLNQTPQISTTTVTSSAFFEDDVFPNEPNPFSSLPYYLMFIIIAVAILAYVYSAICLQFIGRKLDVSWSWGAWIPIVSTFLLIRCAGRPLWWFILSLIPFVNIAIGIIIWMDISENLGKSKFMGLLMLIPIINLIALGYFAFSKTYFENNQQNYTQPPSQQV